jgi:hypothetical protein
MAKSAMASGAGGKGDGFNAKAALDEIQNNPAVQKKMREMMNDPEALAELSRMMQDPAFKKQVEAFTSAPEVKEALKTQGAAGLLSGGAQGTRKQQGGAETTIEGARAHAQAKAVADLEYGKYASQFTGT